MGVLKKILAYAPEKKANVGLSIILAVLSSFLVVLPFYFLWKVLYALLVEKNAQNGMYYAVWVVGLMFLRVIVYLLSLITSHLLAFRVESNMKKKGLEKLLSASFSFFDVNQSGRVRKLIDDNTAETHMVVAHLIPDMTTAMLLPILMMVTLFVLNYKLGIFMIIVTVLGVIIVKGMFGNQEFMKQYMISLETMNSETVEYVRGMQVIKIFNTGVESFNTLFNCIKEYSRLAFNYTLSCRIPYVLFQVVFMLFTAAVIPFAVKYLENTENIGYVLTNVLFFSAFAGMIFGCFMKIMFVGMYQTQASEAVSKLEKLFSDMETKKLEYGSLSEMKGSNIEFKNVSFGYTDDTMIINNLSFQLESGKTYALVGSSGGGKSTIAKLISGFYKINSGNILIGGKDITEYSEETLMKNIAFVFQNTKLFKTTIFENVQIGNMSAGKEEVMQALHAAKCDDILDKFDTRENTVIGAKGVHLSGGETQRIAIARAILKNANIIILDEASAAADPENEYEIQQAFSNLMKDKTVIMIAHRLSSIRNVDEILVIDNGKIIERGTDTELMKKDGKYKQLQELFSKANDWRVL